MSVLHPRSDKVSATETAALIRCSRGKVLALEFGPFGVRLEREPADGHLLSPWAEDLLAFWRGDTVSEGGGL